jgi:high-affinity iron transporter
MRAPILLLLLLFLFLPLVQAQEGTEAARKEMESVRTLLEKSLQAYEAGEKEEAYRAARSAYLDHFENVEIYSRPIDSDLTLELEIEFAELREMIKKGEPADAVRAKISEIGTDLDRIEGLFERASALVPAIATILSFSVIFREGLEALLISAIILAYLEKSRNYALKRYVYRGAALALVATLATWAIFTYVISLTGASREAIEVVVSFAAVFVLFYVTFWLLRRIDEKRWMEFIKAQSWHAMQSGRYNALTLMVFLAVYREGFETVLFYKALYTMTPTLSSWLTLGLILGAGSLVLVGLGIFVFGIRLPFQYLFGLTIFVAASLSIFFVGNAVRELQILGYVPITSLTNTLPRIHPILADLLGYRRTLETIGAQVALAFVYLAGAGYVTYQMKKGEM